MWRTIEPASGSAPQVSVVIPAYNQPGLLREALQSVAGQRGARFFEVVVTDDLGSSDTARVVRECGLPQLRYFRNPTRLGAVGSWNRGLRLARGTWVTVLHEDDLLFDRFLAQVGETLNPDVVAVATRCLSGNQPTVASPPRFHRRPHSYHPEYFLKSAMTPFPGVVMRREVALRLGGFDECWGPLADYEFWYRLAKFGRVEVLPIEGAFYRTRADQWTAAVWSDMLRRAHLLRLAIAQEQFAHSPRIGQWLARFFTHRDGRSYRRRFGGDALILRRVHTFSRLPASQLPSGWVWLGLRGLAWFHRIFRAPPFAPADLPRLPAKPPLSHPAQP